MIVLSVDGALKDRALVRGWGIVLLDCHPGRSAEIQRALLWTTGRSGMPFDSAVHDAAHLLEPPGCPGTEHLAPIGGPCARHHTVKGQVELRPVAALGFEVRVFGRRFRRSADNIFHSLFFLRLNDRTGGWTSIG